MPGTEAAARPECRERLPSFAVAPDRRLLRVAYWRLTAQLTTRRWLPRRQPPCGFLIECLVSVSPSERNDAIARGEQDMGIFLALGHLGVGHVVEVARLFGWQLAHTDARR